MTLAFSHTQYCVRYVLGEHIVYVIVIPEHLPPSLNDLINKGKQWRINQRNKFQFFMSQHCKAIPSVVLDKRAVRIDLFKKSHMDDDPNLDARSKMLLDAMKQLSLIVDDNNKWLDWARVHQFKSNENATVISLSDTMDKEMMKACVNLPEHAKELILNG